MHESLQTWALRQLEAQVKRNMPGARLARQLRADSLASKKALSRVRRSLASQHGVKMRALKMKQAADAQALREKQTVMDAESERRLWDFLIRHG